MSNLITIDLDQLRADIDNLRRQIAEKEAVLRVASTYKVSPNGQQIAPPATESPEIVIVSHSQLKGKALHEIAEAVLQAAGKPLKTAEVVAAIEAAGLARSIKKVLAATYTAMNRKRTVFRKVAPGTWGLVSRGDTAP